MSRLILPAHAAGAMEEINRARSACVVSFTMHVPGIKLPINVSLNQPTPMEGVATAMVNAAMQAIRQEKAEQVADKILAEPNGLLN